MQIIHSLIDFKISRLYIVPTAVPISHSKLDLNKRVVRRLFGSIFSSYMSEVS